MRLFQNRVLLLPVVCSIIAGLWITFFFDTARKMARPDPSSFSDASKLRTTSLNLVLSADLQKAVLSGYVDISFERIDPSCQTFVLDAKDLDVEKVTDSESTEELKYELSEKYKDFGSSLTVHLSSSTKIIRVFYKSSPEASGVQVLKPEQTLGGRHPYFFTQNQAIHARSIVPCQDSPGVKAAYSAQITVAKPLTAVMSAVSVKTVDSGDSQTFFFEQKIPIPSYLIAIVIGDIIYKDISPRVRVWSEKENIDDCFYEFADTDKILQVAESIAGPYVWGRYDLLVLPPSFPYGGMENPCLTFVTPTLLAGDRSLVNVVAHEIAHSWTGNLVTNANWEHFWLNEGFTVFLERKIIGALAGEQGELVRSFAALNGIITLQYTLEVFGADNPLTALKVNLDDVDPDDAFSSVPYEKGFNFLYYLETQVGGPSAFDPFLKNYIQEHAYKSIKSDVFVSYFKSKFPEVGEKVEWEKWLTLPGMPLVTPTYDTTLQDKCQELAKTWNSGGMAAGDLDNLTTKQIISTLTLLHMSDTVNIDVVKKLDNLFKFGSSQNAEILFSWCRVCIKVRDTKIVDTALNFITTQGRMKFVRPLYRDLLGWEEYRQKTVDNFERNKMFYHNICRSMVEKDIQAAK